MSRQSVIIAAMLTQTRRQSNSPDLRLCDHGVVTVGFRWNVGL
jgi:hypothetical protein